MKIKKGDTIHVITGNDTGKSGRVIKVYSDTNRIVVEGVNRPTQENPQGGIIEKEATIHISNVMLVAGSKPTRVGFKFLEDGRKVKFAKKTGEIIN